MSDFAQKLSVKPALLSAPASTPPSSASAPGPALANSASPSTALASASAALVSTPASASRSASSITSRSELTGNPFPKYTPPQLPVPTPPRMINIKTDTLPPDDMVPSRLQPVEPTGLSASKPHRPTDSDNRDTTCSTGRHHPSTPLESLNPNLPDTPSSYQPRKLSKLEIEKHRRTGAVILRAIQITQDAISATRPRPGSPPPHHRPQPQPHPPQQHYRARSTGSGQCIGWPMGRIRRGRRSDWVLTTLTERSCESRSAA